MHIQFLAGAVFAWVIAYVAIGISFCIAYVAYRREPEHLVFGLHAQAIAVYTLGFVLGANRQTAEEVHFAAMVAMGGAALGATLVLHFALIYANVSARHRVIRPVYGLTLLVELANAFGLVLDVKTSSSAGSPWILLGTQFRIHATALGACAVALVCAAQIAATVLLARAVLANRRHGIAPLIGAALMTGTTLHDALLLLGRTQDVWTGPVGGAAFMFMMTGVFVVRSAMLGKKLTDQSAELQRRSGELRHSYEELREAQRELTRKEQLAAIGELAAVIAHEIRNPLAVISNAVAGLKRKDIEQKDRETLLVILKEESSRLNRLVGDLLRYARPITPRKQLLSVREVVDRSLLSLGLGDDVLTEVSQEGELEQVWADPALLRQVFDNLIENAVQAMASQANAPQRLRITLWSEERDGSRGVRIDVCDNGEGMDANIRDRALDPFFTTRPSGTGLGLAIVDRIVDVHGGQIEISSEPRSGTTVTVFLPIGTQINPSSSTIAASSVSA